MCGGFLASAGGQCVDAVGRAGKQLCLISREQPRKGPDQMDPLSSLFDRTLNCFYDLSTCYPGDSVESPSLSETSNFCPLH